MKTPRDKYMNDAEYRCLVDMMTDMVDRAKFTPSEVREAAMLACINYEMRNVRPTMIDDPRWEKAFKTLDEFKDTSRFRVSK